MQTIKKICPNCIQQKDMQKKDQTNGISPPAHDSCHQALQTKERLAFPFPCNEGLVLSKKRILEIYNKQTKNNQKRLTLPVEAWFKKRAIEHTWRDVEFLKFDNSKTEKVCVLYV